MRDVLLYPLNPKPGRTYAYEIRRERSRSRSGGPKDGDVRSAATRGVSLTALRVGAEEIVLRATLQPLRGYEASPTMALSETLARLRAAIWSGMAFDLTVSRRGELRKLLNGGEIRDRLRSHFDELDEFLAFAGLDPNQGSDLGSARDIARNALDGLADETDEAMLSVIAQEWLLLLHMARIDLAPGEERISAEDRSSPLATEPMAFVLSQDVRKLDDLPGGVLFTQIACPIDAAEGLADNAAALVRRGGMDKAKVAKAQRGMATMGVEMEDSLAILLERTSGLPWRVSFQRKTTIRGQDGQNGAQTDVLTLLRNGAPDWPIDLR